MIDSGSYNMLSNPYVYLELQRPTHGLILAPGFIIAYI